MRVKWLSVAPKDYNFNLIGQELLKYSYSEEVGQGFYSSVITDTNIESTFYNKIVELKEVATPFGGPVEEEQVYYDVAKFVLRRESPYLRVDKLPRRNSAFLLAVGKLSGFDIAFIPVEFNVQLVLERLRDVFDKLVIDKLKLAGNSINKQIQSRIVLAGELSVEKSMLMFSNEFNLSITRAWVTLFKDGKRYKIEVDKKGEIFVSDEGGKSLVKIVDKLIHDFMP